MDRVKTAGESKGADQQSDASGFKNPDSLNEQLRVAVGRCTEKRTKDGRVKGTKASKVRITAKQRHFASLIVEGHSQRDAYRQAYDTNTMNEASISVNASRLANSPKIASLLEASLSKRTETIIGDQIATRRYVMEHLIDMHQNAKQENSKLKALELIGKSVSMFTDKVEQTVEAIDTDRLKAELSTHLDLLDSLPPSAKH